MDWRWRNGFHKNDHSHEKVNYKGEKVCFYPKRHERQKHRFGGFHDFKKVTCGVITTDIGCEEFVKCDTVSEFISKCIKSIHYDMAYAHWKILPIKVRIPSYSKDVYSHLERYSKGRRRAIAYASKPGKDVIDVYMRWDRFKNTIYTAQEIRKRVKRYQQWLNSEKNESVYAGQYVTSQWKRPWVKYYDVVVLEELLKKAAEKQWRTYFSERVIAELPLHRARMNVLWKYPIPPIVEKWPDVFDGCDWDYETREYAGEELFDENGNITI